MNKRNNISVWQGVYWLVIWLYIILLSIGVLCIFMVEYKPDTDILQSFLG